MKNELLLRDVVSDDLPIFFEQQLDQEANTMAAFTAKDPTNQEAFMAHCVLVTKSANRSKIKA
jgi:hypothetical protein